METEVHVIIHCPEYDDIRENILQDTKDLKEGFYDNMSSAEKCILLYASSNVYLVKKVTKTCFDMLKKGRSFFNTRLSTFISRILLKGDILVVIIISLL